MAIASGNKTAMDGDESESHAQCAFMWLQNVHSSEEAAIQQGTNELLDFLEVCAIQRQKTNVILEMVEEIENGLYNVLKRLEGRSVPMPEYERKSIPSHLIDDSTSSGKGSIGKLASEERQRLVDEENKDNADHKNHRHCRLGDFSFQRASIMLSLSLNPSSSEERESEDENEDDFIECDTVELTDVELQSDRNKSNSQEQQQHVIDLNTALTMHMQAPLEEISIQRKRKLSDVERQVWLPVLETPSKTNYKDICKQDGTLPCTKSVSLKYRPSIATPTGLTAGHKDSVPTSLSLICSPEKGVTQVHNNSSQLYVDCDTLALQENCCMTKIVDRIKLQNERQAEEIEILRTVQYQQKREIMKLMALCEQKSKDLNEMEEWIAGFVPVMEANELKMTQQETTIMELSETVNELMNLAIALMVVVSSSHGLDFTYSYRLKLQ